MPNREQLLVRREELQARNRELTRQYDAATSSRDEAEQELRRLRARKDRVREEAAARQLVPGEDGGVAIAEAEDEAEQIQARIDEREARIERLAGQRQEVQEELREVNRKLAPMEAERVGEARARRVEALARIASSVLPAYAETLTAREEESEALADLKNTVSQSGTSRRQKRELKQWLQEVEGEVPAEALAGLVLAEVLDWLRLISRGPIPEILEAEGIPGRDGSPRNVPPVGALEGLLAALEAGRLPDIVNL